MREDSVKLDPRWAGNNSWVAGRVGGGASAVMRRWTEYPGMASLALFARTGGLPLGPLERRF